MNIQTPLSEIGRREFIHLGIGAGFALAVSPAAAWAITTSDEGIVAGPVMIPTGGKSMPGYRALPKGKGPFPTVVVIQEIFGIHEYIQDVCRRLAREGYFAVAPSLYFREGDATKIEDISKIVSDIVSKVPQKQVWADLDATLEWLKTTKSSDEARIGITGFCWGGGVTWMYSAHQPKIKAAVAWYGKLSGQPTPINSKFPFDIGATIKTPVLGLYGGQDKGIPQTDVEKMRGLLKQGQSGSEIIVYPDAEHGFHADYRPSYNEKAAKDGWSRLLAWFKAHGVR